MKRGFAIFLTLILLGGAIGAVYFRTVNAQLIFDDFSTILDNPSIVRLWPLFGDAENPGPLNPPKNLPTSGRPLANLSLALNYHFSQLNSFGYHLFNMITHWLVALILAATVWRVLNLDFFENTFSGAAGFLAFLIALLWALDPLQTEPVQYITQRTELMCGFFYLLILYASLRCWATRSKRGYWIWIAIAGICCLLGMACKEMMASAPLVILLFERTFITGSFRQAWRRSKWLYIAFIPALLLLFCISINHPYALTVGFDRGVAAHQWWLTQTKYLWMYAKLCAWPWPLSIHYGGKYLTFVQSLPWLLLTLLLGAMILCGLWRRRSAGFVGACVMLLLLPTMIVPLPTEIAAERRMYLPLAALISLVVAGGYALSRKLLLKKAAAQQGQSVLLPLILISIPSLLIAVVFSWVSTYRLNTYLDPISLWRDTAIKQPDDYVAQVNLGIYLIRSDHYAESLNYFRRALTMRPNSYETYNDMGLALNAIGQTQEAMKCWEKALQISPGFPKAHNNLGNALYALGQNQAALDQYYLVLKNDPSYVDGYADLGNILIKMGRLQEAIVNFQHALKLNPNNAHTHGNYGVVLFKSGRSQEAILEYQRAIQINPQYAEAYYNLGIALSATGYPQEAIEQYQKALAIQPDYPLVHNNLGILLAQAGRTSEAIKHFQLAVKLKPDDAEAQDNLGLALRVSGKIPEAIEHYEQAIRIQPDFIKAYYNLATSYASLHRSAEAIDAAQRAASISRSNGQPEQAAQIETWIVKYRAQEAAQQNSSHATP